MGKQPVFGIVSGAGPLVGVRLMERLFEKLQEQGAWKDSHFPETILYNYPFSEMLVGDISDDQLKTELESAIKFLAQKCDVIYIVCQTLHLFLPDDPSVKSLFDLFAQHLDPEKKYVIISSETSAKNQLHQRNLPGFTCEYLDPTNSQKAINAILRGEKPDLSWLPTKIENGTLLLGCTEFTLVRDNIECEIVDPLDMVITDIINQNGKNGY